MTHEQAGVDTPALDVRLLGPAIAAWVGSATAILAGPVVAAGLSCACVATAVVLVRRHHTRVWAAGLLAVLLVGGGLALATAARAWTSAHNPILSVGGSQVVELAITDDPKLLRGGSVPGVGPRVLVRATLVSDQAHSRLRGAVTVLAPAQGWGGLLPGQHVRVRATASPPRRRDLSAATLTVRGEPELVGAPSATQRIAGSLREGLRTAAGATLGPAEAGLLPGLVLGDTSALPDEVLDDARTAGLTHLTAVSGTNITIVLGAVVLLGRLAGAGPRACAVLAGITLVGFVILVRPSPSVLRAAVMGTIALLALVTGRRRQALPALSGAVVVLLAVRPGLAVDIGFALSVVATGALVLLAPHWVAALRARAVPSGVAELVAVPAAAHLVTAPIIAGISGRFSLVAVLANLLVAPAVGVATVVGVAATLALAVWTPAGEFLVRVAGPPVWWIVHVGRWSAGLPSASVAVPGGTGAAVGMGLVAVGVLVVGRIPALRVFTVAVMLGAAVVVVPARVWSPGWPPTGWVMVACDVGQGDGLVLSLGAGSAVVIDTGTEPAVIDACLDRLGVSDVALVVLTHQHLDHIGGLAGVLDGRSVGAVAMSPLHLPAETVARVSQAASAAGAPMVRLQVGGRLEWPGLVLDTIGPTRAPPATLGSDPGTRLNDSSVVLAAQTRAGRILLTGDVELSAQADLLAGGADLRADILKVPHHGSAVGLPEFFAAVAPRVAMISVGQGNTYGHPAVAVLDELDRIGSTVVRTDRAGDIAIIAADDGPRVVERGGSRPPP